MGYPYDSTEARQLNHDILATIYYGALEASSELAETLGTYDQYKKKEIHADNLFITRGTSIG